MIPLEDFTDEVEDKYENNEDDEDEDDEIDENVNDDEPLPLFKQLSILPLEESLQLKQANFMWKLKNNLLPPSLSSNLRLNNRNQLGVPYNRLIQSASHIKYAGPKLWKGIPSNVQDKTTPKSFSNAMKAFLLDKL